MAIRIKMPSGMEIETDTAEEAVQIYHELETSPNGAAPHANDTDDTASDSEVVLGEKAKAMLKNLLTTAPGKGKTTKVVADAIGVNGPKGLAAVTRQIRAWGKQVFNLDPEECVDRFVSTDGASCLRIQDELRTKLKGREGELLD